MFEKEAEDHLRLARLGMEKTNAEMGQERREARDEGEKESLLSRLGWLSPSVAQARMRRS